MLNPQCWAVEAILWCIFANKNSPDLGGLRKFNFNNISPMNVIVSVALAATSDLDVQPRLFLIGQPIRICLLYFVFHMHHLF